MLAQNPFMPATPQGTPEEEFAYDRMKQEEALRLGMNQMLHGQSTANRAANMGTLQSIAAQRGGAEFGQAFPQVGGALRSTANAMVEPFRQAGRAAQTYLTGGPSSVSKAAAEAPGFFTQVAPYVAGAASAAGMGLNAYQGLQQARMSAEEMREAIDSGLLDNEQIDDLRQRMFEQGMESGTQGANRGAISGIGLGPVGMVAGAASGAAGGYSQATQANQGGPWSDAGAVAGWHADPRNEGSASQSFLKQEIQNRAKKILRGGGLF